jgi:hypothetical protein
MFQYQHFLNFTTVSSKQYKDQTLGQLYTNTKHHNQRNQILFHTVDSINARVMYCADHDSDSPRLRPIDLLSPFSFVTWVVLVFILIFCSIASSFAVLDLISVPNHWTANCFIKCTLNRLIDLVVSLVEKDMGKRSSVKTLLGLTGICLGTNYKNFLTIQLVFPRTANAIQNVTELLDLNFNIIDSPVGETGQDKSGWLKRVNFHAKIDESKREKYVLEVERWLKFLTISNEVLIKMLANVKENNAIVLSAPYYIEAFNLQS